jgi:D-lactate dehydrogenase
LEATKKCGISVTRVPAYSPFAVAEFAVTLMLTLNRNVHKSYNRVREFNFSLTNLVGFDMHGKTVGLLGTGQIGSCTANILLGFGCKVLAYDIKEDEEMKKKGVEYVSKEELYARCDIISIHVPLLKSTHHLVNAEAFKQMKKGVILINTSRGAIIDSKELLTAITNVSS